MTEALDAARVIRARAGGEAIDGAVILGTGLGEVAGHDDADVVFSYADLPGFPQPHVSGHAGRLVIGRRGGMRVAWLQGRAHYYETGDARAMSGALEALAALDVPRLIVTSASGSTRDDLAPGALVRLTDHINFSGLNPLVGARGDDRFVPMNDAYDAAFGAQLDRAAIDAGADLPHGVYMWFSGPSFETPAEVRMAKLLGADLVGMSTVPEVILARRLGLRVAGLSLVTNFAAGFAGGAPDHAGTKRVAAEGARRLKQVLDHYFAAAGDSP
ncbi:MAG: purine-nucleoside phosphorylase [Hyphomicrobiales bacterium]|nr:purine-nucleoside phosphorylase [Hyphomicrobiales bacterium]